MNRLSDDRAKLHGLRRPTRAKSSRARALARLAEVTELRDSHLARVRRLERIVAAYEAQVDGGEKLDLSKLYRQVRQEGDFVARLTVVLGRLEQDLPEPRKRDPFAQFDTKVRA